MSTSKPWLVRAVAILRQNLSPVATEPNELDWKSGLLECGIFAHGFARARCDACGHDYFVAFSCKGRGVCPSCNTRRMVQTAAHLTDHVFPRLPVRQWVLSVPKPCRLLKARPVPPGSSCS